MGDGNKELDIRFTYQTPKPGQPEKYTALREIAKQFAHAVQDMVPESREKALSFTKLEEAVMWANAGIARRE